jgi:hypothetical protein
MPGVRAEFSIPGVAGGATVKSLPDFVYTKGTAFLLYPGKPALIALSEGAG